MENDNNLEPNEAPGNVGARPVKKQPSEVQKASIVTAHSLGRSYRSIALEMGIGREAVSMICRRYEETGQLTRAPGSGRKRKTTDTDDRLIRRMVKNKRDVTGKEILEELGLDNISEWTIRRRISENGEFNSYWATKKNFTNETNRQKRLAWCNARLEWTVEQWHSVLWSDESPFVLVFNNKKRVWRRQNERYDSRCTVATVKHDKKINVWGCFAASGAGDLHVVEGILEQSQYRNILEEHMLPSAVRLFGDKAWFFQQDNDPKHRANLTKLWFEDYSVPVIDWPAQSPDLNPIENLWSILDQRTKFRKPSNEKALFECLEQA